MSGAAAEKTPLEERLIALDEAPIVTKSQGSSNSDLIREALRQRGKPYVWGGASRGGFDCSGFVCYIFRTQRGISLPHSASGQALRGTPVDRSELRPGDLVFFSTYRPGISHVGIFIGGNRFIHASSARHDVRIDELAGYYDSRYRGARRILGGSERFTSEELENLMRDPMPMSGEPE